MKSILEQMEEGHKNGYSPEVVLMTRQQLKELIRENELELTGKILSEEEINQLIDSECYYRGIKIQVI